MLFLGNNRRVTPGVRHCIRYIFYRRVRRTNEAYPHILVLWSKLPRNIQWVCQLTQHTSSMRIFSQQLTSWKRPIPLCVSSQDLHVQVSEIGGQFLPYHNGNDLVLSISCSLHKELLRERVRHDLNHLHFMLLIDVWRTITCLTTGSSIRSGCNAPQYNTSLCAFSLLYVHIALLFGVVNPTHTSRQRTTPTCWTTVLLLLLSSDAKWCSYKVWISFPSTINLPLTLHLFPAARAHTKRDKYIDVQTYSPFGERVFLASETPSARIAASDILSVFDPSTQVPFLEDSPGMIELPPQAFSEYLEYSERQQKRYENMWCAWTAKNWASTFLTPTAPWLQSGICDVRLLVPSGIKGSVSLTDACCFFFFSRSRLTCPYPWFL